ncbi:hypothetical protein F2Q69_00031134 [Brassica cretica]|uniref:Uncharacterized protein n=1 Tax=Brassica cretica TaxID=69181 RepID=A0A8S9SBF4_BRACR|nr:hypothetical protein F2Q69_00031134 [Brassica cretica]
MVHSRYSFKIRQLRSHLYLTCHPPRPRIHSPFTPYLNKRTLTPLPSLPSDLSPTQDIVRILLDKRKRILNEEKLRIAKMKRLIAEEKKIIAEKKKNIAEKRRKLNQRESHRDASHRPFQRSGKQNRRGERMRDEPDPRFLPTRVDTIELEFMRGQLRLNAKTQTEDQDRNSWSRRGRWDPQILPHLDFIT